MSSELLDDYEEGTWSPAFAMTGGDFTTAPTMDIISARYVKVGHMVTFYAYLRTDSVDITGAGGSLAVEGLPYANAGSNNYAAINVGQANFWTNAPSGGYVYSGGDYIVLTKRNTGITGSMTEMTAADLTAGVTANQNQLMISGSYFSF
jgi:roadblock/LC7 domain-containing protein